MNVENNQRYKETEERIVYAYWKLAGRTELHRITVADICREAKIHRTTFYGHFLDIYDLREKAMRKQFMTFLQDFFNTEGKWNFREGMRKQIEFYYRNRKIIKLHLESSEKRERNDIFLEFTLNSKMMKSYQEKFQLNNEKEVYYHQEFFRTGLETVVRQWIRADCEESPKEIADLLCRIFGM